MKLRLLVLFVCYTLAFANSGCTPEKCPDDEGPRLTLLPVPWDCSQFIICQWGEAHYRPCGFGLHYDHNRTVCVPPSKTKCVLCNKSDSGSDSSEPIKDLESGSQDDSNISVSVSDKASDQSKDKSEKKSADLSEKKTSDEITNDDKSQNISTDEEKSVIAETTDTDNIGAEISSDENHESSEIVRETKSEAGKKSTTVPYTSPKNVSQTCVNNSKTSVTCPKNMTDDRLLPHPDDCGLFYYCVDYIIPICRECPAGLHFNPLKKVCDFPERAGCKVQTYSIGVLSRGEDHCDFDPAQGPGTPTDLFPNPEDCSGYLVCVWGQLVPLRCPPEQHFNPSLKVCINSEDSECEKTSTSVPFVSTIFS